MKTKHGVNIVRLEPRWNYWRNQNPEAHGELAGLVRHLQTVGTALESELLDTNGAHYFYDLLDQLGHGRHPTPRASELRATLAKWAAIDGLPKFTTVICATLRHMPLEAT